MVGLFVFEHGVEDIAPTSGQADQGGVVFFAFGSLLVVIRPAGRIVQCGEGGQEERTLELAVAEPGGLFALMEVPDLVVTGAMPA